jgi:hypothetical protein
MLCHMLHALGSCDAAAAAAGAATAVESSVAPSAKQIGSETHGLTYEHDNSR